jgi:hypothetical protein
MNKFSVFLFFLAAGVSQFSIANAQWASTTITTMPQAGQRYVVLGGTRQANSSFCGAFCLNDEGIDINQFANANDVSATFNSLNAQLNRSVSKLYDLVAVSAALQDAIPNQGDRFALRINMSGYQGHVAGAIGGSININEMLRFSVNYGLGKHEDMISGGMNFSFR